MVPRRPGKEYRPRDIGEHLTRAVRKAVWSNPSLSGVIDLVDFAAEGNSERDINLARLAAVVETFSDSPCRLGLADMQPDFLGRAYEYPKYPYHFLSFRYESIRRLAHGGQQQCFNLEIVRNPPLAIPVDKDPQSEIIAILDDLDYKNDLHDRKPWLLDELFQVLLREPMTGEIRITELCLAATSKGYLHFTEVASS